MVESQNLFCLSVRKHATALSFAGRVTALRADAGNQTALIRRDDYSEKLMTCLSVAGRCFGLCVRCTPAQRRLGLWPVKRERDVIAPARTRLVAGRPDRPDRDATPVDRGFGGRRRVRVGESVLI